MIQNKISQHENVDIYVVEECFISHFCLFSTHFFTSLFTSYSVYWSFGDVMQHQKSTFDFLHSTA